MCIVWVVLASLALPASSARACSQVNDGGITVIDYAVTDCLLLINGGTTLVVVEGGSVIPEAISQDAIRVNPGTAARIQGGLAWGSPGGTSGGCGLYAWGGGVVHVSTGDVRGGFGGTSGGDGVQAVGAEMVIGRHRDGRKRR